MRKIHCIVLAAGLLPAAVFASCEAPSENKKEVAGTVIGAVIGGVVGSQIGHGSGRTAGAIVGTVAGGFVGNSIGKNMDATDHLKACQALENAHTGEPTTWRNPHSGTTYTVTPTRTYQATEGPCRDYTMDAKVGDKSEQVRGTACRASDGNWHAEN
jgi:surface antigen